MKDALSIATRDVNCRYGASMGRRSKYKLDTDAGKIQLFKIPLDSGGYDRGGAYWGLGAPLYCAMDQNADTHYFRASDRLRAKEIILEDNPDARFYR